MVQRLSGRQVIRMHFEILVEDQSEAQITAQLEGILGLRDIVSARVVTLTGESFFRGVQSTDEPEVRSYSLVYISQEKPEILGTLIVTKIGRAHV